jgi:hypothetical protein
MKKLFSLFTLLSLAATISFAQVQKAPATEETADGPKMELTSTTVDFGTIEQDSDPFRTISFTNTGNEPLIIKNAKGSCGCTVPTYEKAPILPGETSEIKIRYATNRLGKINKTVTLYTNEGAEVKRVLKVVGMVNKKAKQPEAVPSAAPSILTNPNGKSQ